MVEQQDTRAALIEAAEDLFAQKGFEGASVKEICEKAGVNVSLVSYHFEGKEGLYRTVLETFAGKGMELAERLLSAPKSKEEFLLRLQMFAEELVGTHVRHPKATRILHRECSAETSVARDVFQRTFHKVFEQFVAFLTVARKNGFLRKDIEPVIAAGVFFASVSHFCNTDELRKALFGLTIHDADFRKRAVDHLFQIFVRGVQS